MIVIAVSGWKQSGKDLSANFLVNKYGFKRLAFADALKVNVSQQYDIPLEWLHSDVFKEKPIIDYPVVPKDLFAKMITDFMYREFRSENGEKFDSIEYNDNGAMVGIGLDGVRYPLFHTPRSLAILEGSTKRSVDSSYWVRRAFKSVDTNGLYVLSDVRYESEISILRKSLGPGDTIVTIRINRFETIDSTDPSERNLDRFRFDHYVNNSLRDGVTKESVYEQLDAIITTVLFGERL